MTHLRYGRAAGLAVVIATVLAVPSAAYHDGKGTGEYLRGVAKECIEITAGSIPTADGPFAIRLARNKCDFEVDVFYCFKEGGDEYYRCGTNPNDHQRAYTEGFGLAPYQEGAAMGDADTHMIWGACRAYSPEGAPLRVGSTVSDGAVESHRCFYPVDTE